MNGFNNTMEQLLAVHSHLLDQSDRDGVSTEFHEKVKLFFLCFQGKSFQEDTKYVLKMFVFEILIQPQKKPQKARTSLRKRRTDRKTEGNDVMSRCLRTVTLA